MRQRPAVTSKLLGYYSNAMRRSTFNVQRPRRQRIDPITYCKLEGEGHSEVVGLLLDDGADAHVRDNSGTTPLHIAATYGFLKVARMILEHNVEVNARDDNGSTPLIKTSTSGDHDVVQLLLDHNADVGVRDNSGNTALRCGPKIAARHQGSGLLRTVGYESVTSLSQSGGLAPSPVDQFPGVSSLGFSSTSDHECATSRW